MSEHEPHHHTWTAESELRHVRPAMAMAIGITDASPAARCPCGAVVSFTQVREELDLVLAIVQECGKPTIDPYRFAAATLAASRSRTKDAARIAALESANAKLRAALESIHMAYATAAGRVGCGDNSCLFFKPKGMATNGGCRCIERGAGRPFVAAALAKLFHACETALDETKETT